MANNVRTQPDGTWVDGYVPTPADWEDLERKIFSSWNGDQGGAYCPSTEDGGQAYEFAGAGLEVSGDTRLTYGGAIRGGSSAFVVRDGTWPQLSSSHEDALREIVQPILDYTTERQYLWSREMPYGGVGSVALACRLTSSRDIETSDLYVPLRVVDGSTLVSVELTFRVATRRTYAPIAMPKMRVLRIPKSITLSPEVASFETLRAANDGFDFTPLVTSPETWWNEGEAQSFVYVCDQNNVIDVENYQYVVHIVEEVGALTPDDEFDGIRFVERKYDVGHVQASKNQDFTGLDGTADAVGGDTIIMGWRMLMVDEDRLLEVGTPGISAVNNGIWCQNSGAWYRAEDCADAADFTPNWIVLVSTDKQYRGSCWQCQYPSNKSRMDLTATAATSRSRIHMTLAKPKGNIYHSLTPKFAVTELRFQ